MPSPRSILRVGLTGGIASGKTTVAGILAELGALVVDADRIAHEIVEPNASAYARVVERFGPGILDECGRIVRSRLARQVFHDDEARRALDAIMHPEIRAEAMRRIEAQAPPDEDVIAIFDAALLVETGAYRDFQRLVVVCCSVETQLERIRTRDGLSEQDARARVDAQAPIERKTTLADYIIDTNGTLEATRRHTEEVWFELRRDFEREFPRLS